MRADFNRDLPKMTIFGISVLFIELMLPQNMQPRTLLLRKMSPRTPKMPIKGISEVWEL